MMAVDSKQGTNGTNGTNGTSASSPSVPVTAQGTGTTPTIRQSDAGGPKRKRSSSLMKSSASLPTVEHSLEEFIAKANQTLVDVSSWEDAKEQDAQRKEQDAQRWNNAEVQMRESEAREQSLRRQLDGLQGKLAEAEARAAVAGTQMGSAAHDTTINELKQQIEKSMLRMRSAEERSQELASEVTRLQTEGSARTPLPSAVPGLSIDEGEADERVRMAEAKAAKAIAAARAAQAGLTVSSADIAAIESGLVVIPQQKKSSPALPIALAFIGGLGIMFVVWKFVLKTETSSGVTPAQVTQPVQVQQPAPPPAPPTTPTVTPIEDKPTPAAVQDDKKPGPSVTPIEEPTPAEVKVQESEKKTEETPKAVEPPKDQPKAVSKAAPKATPKKAPKATPKKVEKKGAIADPFADSPKKETKKPAEKKPGTIVDPF